MHIKLSNPERLKDLRLVDKHLILEQLAEQTGLSKSALSKYESDDYKDISPFAHRYAGGILRGVHRLSDGTIGKKSLKHRASGSAFV